MRSESGLTIVTGASSGIGLELARLAAAGGGEVLLAAQDPGRLEEAARQIGGAGGDVLTVAADLSTVEGVDALLQAVAGRQIDILCANAGHGQGGAFLDHDWESERRVIDTNVTGTVYLIHRVGNLMREQGFGRILVTGSIAGTMPGPNHAVYHATKAFVNSFAAALRSELEDSGVSVTNLMPGATDTNFFERAGLQDAKVHDLATDDPADVAKTGWEAMMEGVDHVTHGLKNKAQVAMASIAPSSLIAAMGKNANAPGSAR